MEKRPVPLYDFKAFGQAIKAARMKRKKSRNDVCDAMNLSVRYLANIENKGQQPSLKIFYELDTLLVGMSNDGLEIVTATAQKVVGVEKKHEAAAQ